jgi:hypothetical protein
MIVSLIAGSPIDSFDLRRRKGFRVTDGPFDGVAKRTAMAEADGKRLAAFDYGLAAELFPSRSRRARVQPIGYKRFARAADAIRFAVEDLPPERLVGAFLEVDEERFDGPAIRRLYDSHRYPLARRSARR